MMPEAPLMPTTIRLAVAVTSSILSVLLKPAEAGQQGLDQRRREDRPQFHGICLYIGSGRSLGRGFGLAELFEWRKPVKTFLLQPLGLELDLLDVLAKARDRVCVDDKGRVAQEAANRPE